MASKNDFKKCRAMKLYYDGTFQVHGVGEDSIVAASHARCTTNGMCTKNSTHMKWHKQAIME